jgi:nucleoside-diphosphate-sugar epimerase
MRALVTGGCGFIGSNLTHELVKRGWKVDIVDDMSNGFLEFLDGLDIKVVPGFMLPQYEEKYESARDDSLVLVIQDDIESKDVLRRIEAGKYDRVFHLAANPRISYTVEHPANTFDINVTRTVKMLESVNRAPHKVRFIFSSTSSVYGDAKDLPTPESQEKAPLSPYGLQKLTVEEFLRLSHRLYGTDSVCLRYANVYGPRQFGNSPYSTAISAWCQKMNDGEPLRSDGDGEQTRDMVFVGDVVRANILAATREEGFDGIAMNVGTETRVSNNHILGLFRQKFGEVKVNHAPTRPGDVRNTQLSISTANSQLGYVPQVALEEGLARTWSWWGL